MELLTSGKRDKKQTLSQNYKRLGLTARMNHISGGTEKTAATLKAATTAGMRKDRFVVSNSNATIEEIAVERDPKTGAVLRVVDSEPSRRSNPLNDPLSDLEESDVEEWEGFDNIPTSRTGAETDVTDQLEDLASRGVRKAPRKQSEREQEWVQGLVEKYGDDYAKMFRDTKLNPMQQSEGDIKRRILKWKKTKGFE